MKSTEVEAFLAVVSTSSITSAAKSLFLSQSTLSHRIKQLEHSMRVKLINRGRGIKFVTLTQYGQEFLPIARK